jgi:hypothetical protein
MFKTNSRKGLAIGAALSLVFSAFAATPAQAAGEVVLEPSAGTSYSTFVTEKFDLIASLAPGQVAANISQLKYKIDKASGFAVSYSADATASAVTAVGSATSVASASTSFVLTPTNALSTVANKLSIAIVGATTASSSVDVTVTAFLDSNSNGTLDSGEFSQARTVSFKKYADVATVISLTQPLEGDTSLKGTASLTGINTDQMSATVAFVASIGGTATGSATLASGTYTTAVAALAAAATVSAQVTVGGHNVGAAATTLTVTAATVKSVTASSVTGDNASAGVVRPNSTFVVKGTALNGTTSTASGVAGAAMTLAVTTSATLTSTQSITIGTVTYTSSSALPTALAVTADASGNANVTVATAGLTSGTVGFTFTSQNKSSGTFVATLTAASYGVDDDTLGYVSLTPATSFTVNYTVTDQWGVALSRADRLKVSYEGTSKYVNLTAGKGAVTFTSTVSGVTSDVTVDNLETQDATTLNWSTTSATTTSGVVSVKSTSTANAFSVSPVATTSGSIARASDSATAKLNNGVSLTGQVNNPGAKVTVTATGVTFLASGKTTTANGSVTLDTDASGYFTVSAFITKAGDTTINYLTGTATKSTVVTVAAAAYNEGKTLTVTTNAVGGYVKPGSTLRSSVKLVDEYGNAVEVDDAGTASFAVTVAGPGFVGTLPSKTGSTGSTADFNVLLGSTDTGTLTITATYDADGAGTTYTAVTKTETVTIGSAPVAAPTGKLTVGSFKGFLAIYASGYEGKKLSYKVAGKWGSVASLKAFERVVRKTGAGYTVKVDLYVDGSLVKSETVTTK